MAAAEYDIELPEVLRDPAHSVSAQVYRLLSTLRHLRGDMPVDQLSHSIQAALRAIGDVGMDDDWVVAALCHDIGKVIPHSDHATASAWLLRPYVSPEVVTTIALHDGAQVGVFPPGLDDEARERAELFVRRWDLPSFDEVTVPPLDMFAELLARVFTDPSPAAVAHSASVDAPALERLVGPAG